MAATTCDSYSDPAATATFDMSWGETKNRPTGVSTIVRSSRSLRSVTFWSGPMRNSSDDSNAVDSSRIEQRPTHDRRNGLASRSRPKSRR